jgi:hypothetical protein
MTPAQIDALVANLELDLNWPGLCRACLLFVSESLREEDPVDARRWARRMTPDILEDGLGEHAIDAVRRARRAGIPGAGSALEELLERGGRSAIARAIVLRLAAEQAEEDRRWLLARLN